LTLEDNLLTCDDDLRGSMRSLVAETSSRRRSAQEAGAAHKRGLAGLLAEPGHQPGVISRKTSGPVVYEDEERTF
jgi:hypothetical protein